MGIRQTSQHEIKFDNTVFTLPYLIFGIILLVQCINAIFFVQTGSIFSHVLLWIAGLLVLVISAACFGAWKRAWRRATLSKVKRMLEVKEIGRTSQYGIKEIEKIELAQESNNVLNKYSKSFEHHLYFVMNGGRKLDFTHITDRKQDASKIAEFLGVPFEFKKFKGAN